MSDEEKRLVLAQAFDWSRWPKLAAIFQHRPRVNVYWQELADFVVAASPFREVASPPSAALGPTVPMPNHDLWCAKPRSEARKLGAFGYFIREDDDGDEPYLYCSPRCRDSSRHLVESAAPGPGSGMEPGQRCPVEPARPSLVGPHEHEYGVAGATIYCIDRKCGAEWDLPTLMEGHLASLPAAPMVDPNKDG